MWPFTPREAPKDWQIRKAVQLGIPVGKRTSKAQLAKLLLRADIAEDARNARAEIRNLTEENLLLYRQLKPLMQFGDVVAIVIARNGKAKLEMCLIDDLEVGDDDTQFNILLYLPTKLDGSLGWYKDLEVKSSDIRWFERMPRDFESACESNSKVYEKAVKKMTAHLQKQGLL